ncbi:MAG: cell division protein ZapA [Clostridiales bacterium]|nr:cell division protein ZapA [Clostridiales bacterium]
MMNRVKVTISGKEYPLQTNESPEYIMGVARQLSKKIDTVVESSDNISTSAATTLVALSILDELEKANANIDNIRTQIREYVDEAGKARAERDAALKQIKALEEEIDILKGDIELLRLSSKLDENQMQLGEEE